jgi:hypothetical protein
LGSYGIAGYEARCEQDRLVEITILISLSLR